MFHRALAISAVAEVLHRRRIQPKGFREDHFIALLDAAQQQLGGPIVLVWDGLPAYKSARMRTLIAASTNRP